VADGDALGVSEGVTEALGDADSDVDALAEAGSTASPRALDDAQPASSRTPATARTHRRGFTRTV